MAKTIDINTLGTEYIISDPEGTVVKTIRIFLMDDILDAGIGAFIPTSDNMSEYLEKSIKAFTGFDGDSSTKVLWYSTFDSEVSIQEVLEYAIIHDYDKVVLEHLDDFDELDF